MHKSDGSIEAEEAQLYDARLKTKVKQLESSLRDAEAHIKHLAAMNEQLVGDVVVLKAQVASLQRGEDMTFNTQLWAAQEVTR